jgi:predicted NAD/FAD-binding protein
MRLAIVGTGIAGLTAAHRLHSSHDITVFEGGGHIGGHTHTHDIELNGRHWAIDTGFIVFNDWTYPNFIALMDELGVESQPSSMSFSVRCENSGLEYNGTTLNTLFAQRRNLFSPSFHRMIRDILRFNREAPSFLEAGDDTTRLGDYLNAKGYRQEFREHYIIPMGAAIWSAAPGDMLDFPARYFIRFFHNHGMLSVDDRPQWRVIRGGSRSYVEPLTAPFRERIHLNTPVVRIVRDEQGVTLQTATGSEARFDAVVLACHSDQALAMHDKPTHVEREILGAIPYQENETILHTDAAVLPRARRAWAAWNYHIPREARDRVAVTYDMNILQGLEAPETFCVSLNYSDRIDPARILKRLTYHHPAYTPAGIAAQTRHAEISGVNRTYYAGAYWGFGFHEDGVKSGLRVAEQIDRA